MLVTLPSPPTVARRQIQRALDSIDRVDWYASEDDRIVAHVSMAVTPIYLGIECTSPSFADDRTAVSVRAQLGVRSGRIYLKEVRSAKRDVIREFIDVLGDHTAVEVAHGPDSYELGELDPDEPTAEAGEKAAGPAEVRAQQRSTFRTQLVRLALVLLAVGAFALVVTIGVGQGGL